MTLEGRVALVTGGGRGIGRAIAIGLATDGADVAVNYRRDDEAAAETVAAIEALGRRGLAARASVDDIDEVRSMVDTVVGELGGIDILVNNAGIASRGQPVVKQDPAELERVIATHALGAHHVTQAVLPSMREADRGDVIMISSSATKTSGAGGAPYNMAKAALEALALTLANEQRANGVRVNIVAPGLVETEMGRRLVKGAAGIEDIRTLDSMMPFGRVCQPEDVAAVVRALVGDAGAYVTGQKVYVDGGQAGF